LIEQKKQDHKKQFSERSAARIFQHCTYFVGKLSTSIRSRDQMGLVATSSIRDLLSRFKTDLLERGEHFAEAHYMQDIELISYALGRYEHYIHGTAGLNADDAYILAGFVDAELRQLRKIADEIDDEYRI